MGSPRYTSTDETAQNTCLVAVGGERDGEESEQHFRYSSWRSLRFLETAFALALGGLVLVLIVRVHGADRLGPWVVSMALMYFILAVRAVYLRRRLYSSEPESFTINHGILQMRWRDTTQGVRLSEVNTGDLERPAGSLQKAVRLTVGDASFLVFTDLIGFEEFMEVLRHADPDDDPGVVRE